MKRILTKTLIVIAILSALSMSATVRAETIETRIGKLSFTHDFANGYPTKETVEKLYDERDFQRACQLYLWALPIVAVPPNAPVKQFWSLTIYEVNTRSLVQNKEQIADRSSRQADLVKNPDGSVDLYVSPTAPKGFEKNWIPSESGRAWFAYFRLYAPTEVHFNRTWILPDFEKVK